MGLPTIVVLMPELAVVGDAGIRSWRSCWSWGLVLVSRRAVAAPLQVTVFC